MSATTPEEFISLTRLKWEIRLPQNYTSIDAQLLDARVDAIARVTERRGVPLIDADKTIEVQRPIGKHAVVLPEYEPWSMSPSGLTYWDANGDKVSDSMTEMRLSHLDGLRETLLIGDWPVIPSRTMQVTLKLSTDSQPDYPLDALRAEVASEFVSIFKGTLQGGDDD